jgi:hypothetical protein
MPEAESEGTQMLLTQDRTEERVWRYVREAGTLYATVEDVAGATGGNLADVREALDDLVARSVLRRFDTPGESPVYWS